MGQAVWALPVRSGAGVCVHLLGSVGRGMSLTLQRKKLRRRGRN